MNKANIGKKARVSVRWDVLPIDYSKEAEKNIITKLANKYGIDEKQISVDVNYVIKGADGKKSSILSDSMVNVADPKYQHELFKEYMASNGLDDIPFEEILKIDSQINAMVNYDAYEKSRNYKIEWIYCDNFLCYGPDNFFDFTQLHGLVLLNGEPANKSGKSTFGNDLLRFALFGKTKTGKASKLDHYFNNYRPDCNEVKVECGLLINGERYVIKRCLTRPDKTKKNRNIVNKVNYYKISDSGEEEKLADVDNLEGESTTKTNKIIKETIGNEEDFDLIVSANSKDLDDLISLKDTERGRIMSRWTGLSILEDKEAKAKEVWTKLSQNRYCDIYNRETIRGEIDQLKNDIEEAKVDIEKKSKKLKESEENIEKLKKNRDSLLLKKKPIDENLTKYDIQTIKTKMDKMVVDGQKKKGQVEKIESELNGIGEVTVDESKIESLNAEKDKINKTIGSLEYSIKAISESNKNLTSATMCPYCGRKMDTDEIKEKIKSNNDEIEKSNNSINVLNMRKEQITAHLDTIAKNRALERKKNELELKKATLSLDVTDLRTQYKNLKKIMDDISKNSSAIEENNRLDADIRVANDSIAAEEKIEKTLREDIVSLKKDIEGYEKSITDKETIIKKIEVELDVERLWNCYIRMVGKNGICKMILGGILPRINGELNRLLGDIADFTIEMEVDFKNDVVFWLVRDGVQTRLAGASGYERTMGALALRFVLGQISNLSKPPFLLLDEILGGIAKENYDDIKKLYDKIVPSYDFVFHITHLESITDWHDSIVTIQKIDNISSIKAGL